MEIRIYTDTTFHELNYTSYKELIEIFNQYRDCYWDNDFTNPWLYNKLEINYTFWDTDVYTYINTSLLLETIIQKVLDVIEEV